MKLKPLHDNQEINDSVVQHPIIKNLVNRDLSSLEKENFYYLSATVKSIQGSK